MPAILIQRGSVGLGGGMDAAKATLDLVAERGTERFPLKVEIGAPRYVGGSHEEWACPIAIRGLYDRLSDVRGADSFQALCLAVSLVRPLLKAFMEDGGSLMQDGQPFPIEAYGFGSTFRST